jgi:transposase
MSAIALLTDHYSYYLYATPTDMRKSFDGLCGIIQNELGRSTTDRDIFIFLNRRCSHVKLLLHEADGFTLLHRRLHKGRFTLPALEPGTNAIQISSTELLSMLARLQLHRSKKRA